MIKSYFVIDQAGTQTWITETGISHRSDGPAIIWNDGSFFWYNDGIVTCENGPAVYYATTKKFHWFFRGINYYFDEWCCILDKSEEDILFLKLKYNI